MVTQRVCRGRIVKLLAVVGITYFLYALAFLGSIGDHENDNNGHVRAKDSVVNSVYEVLQKEGLLNRSPESEHIDKNEVERARRLKTLEEIYKVPRSNDSVYKLNETLSRTIELDRKPPDLRPDRCKTVQYDLNLLPTVSVILPIYNEALSMILRTVHSIINNTPASLLVDIILVDDNSKNENLKEPLDQYLKHLPDKVQVVRNPTREGLIRARMRGAKVARGEVLVFQDSHTEMSSGWAEAMLDYIRKYPNTVVQPVVEELNPLTIQWSERPFSIALRSQAVSSLPKSVFDTSVYSDIWRGVFMWHMGYAWNMAPAGYSSWRLQEIDPWPNPVLVGCALGVQKTYFERIGGFDEGLQVWGGENMELSFRTWMCGGRVVIHPCSRIAHVFKPFSYSFDGDSAKIVAKNSMRVVETWMDEFRDYYYASNRVYDFKRVDFDESEKASLRLAKAHREKLQCKSFSWYLNNVLPEMARPPKDQFMFGEIQNWLSKQCWMVTEDGYIETTTNCYTYSRMRPEAEFGLTDNGRLMYKQKCVIVTDEHLMRVIPCDSVELFRQTGWSIELISSRGESVGVLKFALPNKTKKCIQQVTNILQVHHMKQMPQMADCREGDEWQVWYFSYRFDYSLVPPPPV